MRWFTIVTVMGVFGIPFVGYSMDTLGFATTRAITASLGCLWSLLTLVPREEALLLSFGVYALFRTFTFNYYFAFLADRLGFRFFGVLAGASFFAAGVLGLAADPLLTWGHGPCAGALPGHPAPLGCDHGHRWKVINVVKLATMATLFVGARDARRAERAQGGKAAAPGQYGAVAEPGKGPSMELPPRGSSYTQGYEPVARQLGGV